MILILLFHYLLIELFLICVHLSIGEIGDPYNFFPMYNNGITYDAVTIFSGNKIPLIQGGE